MAFAMAAKKAAIAQRLQLIMNPVLIQLLSFTKMRAFAVMLVAQTDFFWMSWVSLQELAAPAILIMV